MDLQDLPEDATKTTNVVRTFLDRLEEKRLREQVENDDLYKPTPEDIVTFLHVLDWIKDHSTTYTGAIDFDEHNLSITIDHQTDSTYFEEEEIVTDSALSVIGTMNSTYNFMFGYDKGEDDLRCLAFQSLMEKLSVENIPSEETEEEDESI